MEQIKLKLNNIYNTISESTIDSYKNEVQRNNLSLHSKNGLGNEFTGWIDLPSTTTEKQITEIETIANELKKTIDTLVVIGIGGSYLGAKAVINLLSDNFSDLQSEKNNIDVYFAGINLNEDYLFDLLKILKDKSYGICVISKSGTTIEPAIAFRILKNDIEKRFGKKNAQKRIVAITDANKGALKEISEKEGYKMLTIPDDIGGRYSVLTPVGLLPIAIAGFDIRKIINGAKLMEEITGLESDYEKNIAAKYAIARYLLYKSGYKIEISSNYNPKLTYLTKWWQQLFAESEGKQNKGILPISLDFTTDLHSIGQLIQEGERNIFETVIWVNQTKNKLTIPKTETDADNLNYLSGKRINEINQKACQGTIQAHIDGGVPNILIEIPELSEFYIGQLLYFFEKACGISGYLLNVNPFDQPGVEAYKKNMFKLLGKK